MIMSSLCLWVNVLHASQCKTVPTNPARISSPKQHFLTQFPNHSALIYWFPFWSWCTHVCWMTDLFSSWFLHVLTDVRCICCLITGSAWWEGPIWAPAWSVTFCCAAQSVWDLPSLRVLWFLKDFCLDGTTWHVFALENLHLAFHRGGK